MAEATTCKTKMIEVDQEAFDRLTAARLGQESVSETIKRVVPDTATRPQSIDVEAWFRSIRENPMSDEALDAIEEQVAQRRAPWNGGQLYDVPGHEPAGRPDAGAKTGSAGSGEPEGATTARGG